MRRRPCILHCTSEPLVFVGRRGELDLLDRALMGDETSVVVFVGPGGQGKTAIVQHWLHQSRLDVAGLFFWSFYRGKDVESCLRHWLAYAEGLDAPPEVSASWCVDRVSSVLRRERWAVVLDGAEVVQHEEGPWRGRFVHPDLGRLLEELASEGIPGTVVVTTRFEVPTLARRRFAKVVTLDRLDPGSARQLLLQLGVTGEESQLDRVASLAGRHAKAVELAGTYLARFHGGRAAAIDLDEARSSPLPPRTGGEGSGVRGAVDGSAEPLTPDPSPLSTGERGESACEDEEASVARVLFAFQRVLTLEQQDVLALATAFREPPTEALLLDYLDSDAVRALLHATRGREYVPFRDRERGWLNETVSELVRLRLLERVGPGAVPVIDAHPLVRRAFEQSGQESALARAGFLRGRPDRRRPANLDEAREAVERFHALCDAGLWLEADAGFAALENPKHRFLAPALERDLLLRFFPEGDFRKPPLWSGFGRWRSLAIALEMLGAFEDALDAYRPADAALRGDALLALGRLTPLLEVRQVPAPWQTLHQAYRCHALCLAGRVEEAVGLARSLVPVDVYEWTHVFECLLRANRLDLLDPRSVFTPTPGEHRWAELARRRMRADYRRASEGPTETLGDEYRTLVQEYDRAGLPVERGLSRLGLSAWAFTSGKLDEAKQVAEGNVNVLTRMNLPTLLMDTWELLGEIARCGNRKEGEAYGAVTALRAKHGIRCIRRP